MKRKEEDYEIKFWKKWLHADTLKRQELVKNLPIVREWLNTMNFKSKNNREKKLMKQAFVSLLNGYFEDLESAVHTKIRLEKKQKRDF